MSTPQRVNELGQPIGEALPEWTPRPVPEQRAFEGRTCRLERLDVDRHGEDLLRAFADAPATLWTYLPVGPFPTREEHLALLAENAASTEYLHYAVVVPGRGAAGSLSLMDVNPAVGGIEIGWVCFSPALQRTTASTEAHYLLMRHAMDDLGYRRLAWRCDHLNAPSRAAAERLGYTFEGTFRNATIYKGRTRDTDWLSITDAEWPAVQERIETWLAPENFDDAGVQRKRLRDVGARL